MNTTTTTCNSQDIRSFHRRHPGGHVFLIGNGPSLASTPLDRLVGEHSIAMNRIALLYDRTAWRPTHFVCTTRNVARPDWRRDILRTVELGIPCFVWRDLLEHFPDRPNVVPVACSHGSEVTADPPDEWWSDDASIRVCKFGTSMLPAIQFAVYMGFTDLFLLGCDLGFRRASAGDASADPNHFHPDYGTPGLGAAALNTNMIAAHQLARRMADRLGVRIFNATPGGDLELHPRVRLEDVL